MAQIRKWPKVDILKIKVHVTETQWNAWLTKCLAHWDIEELKKCYYGLQVSMHELSKQKLNDDDIVKLFIRLTMSIEKTFKSILREKYPNPLYEVKFGRQNTSKEDKRWQAIKRARENELELFFRDIRF